jgi:hypothetical protein
VFTCENRDFFVILKGWKAELTAEFIHEFEDATLDFARNPGLHGAGVWKKFCTIVGLK